MNLFLLREFSGRQFVAFGRKPQNNVFKVTEFLIFCKKSKKSKESNNPTICILVRTGYP